MKDLNLNFIITVASIILSAGTTIGYIKTTMGTMETQLVRLTEKVERHNNFGLRIVELETKVQMLEKQLENTKR